MSLAGRADIQQEQKGLTYSFQAPIASHFMWDFFNKEGEITLTLEMIKY